MNMTETRFFDPIEFNDNVITLCKSKGLNPENITDREWQSCYDLAREDYDSALSDALFYATF